jgi:hypothetical protein
LSKTSVDYKSACKEELLEIFTMKNLDTLEEAENQNATTKSLILAPFNSSKGHEGFEIIDQDLKIENKAIKIVGNVKAAFRNYELNNNGEIDNGILIKPGNL